MLFLCGLFFINPVFAENFVIKNYDVQINVKENNVLNIKETIDTNFHKRSHGIFRTIPTINKIVRADGTKETKKAKVLSMKINNNYQTFYKNAITEIYKRKQLYDIVLPFWGAGGRPICDALDSDFIIIEPGIGYGEGSWAEFRVFESYAIFHAYCGTGAITHCNMRNYDVIIPNYFDIKDFEPNFNQESRLQNDPYLLYLGRVYDGKGVHIALQICEALGVKLKIAGQMDEFYASYKWPSNVEYVGYADAKKRSDLMRNAVASFLPSQYLEPFGGVQIENLLCGTPTITSDWGAFAENNIHGETGYRCRTFDDYLQATLNCLQGKIDYRSCYQKGLEFSLDNIAPKYEKFFNDVLNIYTGNGWYELSEDTKKQINNLNN